MSEKEMTPEDALRTMATVTSRTSGLRVRTEGLTLVIWAICIAASYLAIVAPILHGEPGGHPPPGGFPPENETGDRFEHPPPPTAFFFSRFAPLAWYAIAVVVTLAIWRSASLSFQHGLSTPRLIAVFVGWLAIFGVASVVIAFIDAPDPQAWHLLAWTIVLGLFALTNPLQFSSASRIATAIMAAFALVTAIYGFVAHLGGRDLGFLSGIGLGVPGLVAGLWLMFRA